jgi:hypothetical protein|tara:strand:+ start:3177 stop:3704 length:528 start_codon:yes stop_codon:yes gene_type:complete
MSHLTARKDFGYTIEPIQVVDIIKGIHLSGNPNRRPVHLIDRYTGKPKNMDDEFWTDMIAKKNSVKSARYYYLCYQIKTNDCIEHPVPLFREGDKVYDYRGNSLRVRVCDELGYTSIDCIVVDNEKDLDTLVREQTIDTRRIFPKDVLEGNEIPGHPEYELLMNTQQIWSIDNEL